MARRRPRQCARCSTINVASARQCTSCGTFLVKKPFRMTSDRIKLVHALANQKGLDREMYKLRLQAVGVGSCKEMKRKQFDVFVKMMKKLPDAPGKRRAA